MGLFDASTIIYKLLAVPGIIFAFSFKGLAQSYVSKKLGDPTPEAQGRLTLNPLAHIDIIGFICMIIFGFGWGKPMPTNSRFYKNVKRDRAIFCLSGPVGLIVASFGLTGLAALLSAIFSKLGLYNSVISAIWMIFYYAALYPLYLATFYLLPLPGLDGYNLVTNFLPYSCNEVLYKIERYSMFIFLGFILLCDFTNLADYIYAPSGWLFSIFNSLWSGLWGIIIR